MPTHTITQTYFSGSGSLSGSVSVTDDTELNSDLVLAPGAASVELDLAFVRSKVKSLCFYCTGDCTVKTNTSGGADTIVLAAQTPCVGGTTAAVAVLLPTADVTKLYLSSTSGGTFSFRAIIHEVP